MPAELVRETSLDTDTASGTIRSTSIPSKPPILSAEHTESPTPSPRKTLVKKGLGPLDTYRARSKSKSKAKSKSKYGDLGVDFDFERDAVLIEDFLGPVHTPTQSNTLPSHHHTTTTTQSTLPKIMDFSSTPIAASMMRRPPVRMDAEDGPWSISVAESPHDGRSYSLYVKTPTHNLTLTRTALELVELDQKLRESIEGPGAAKLPSLPFDGATIRATTQTPKRKSNFLHTLSRLTSPASNRDKFRGSGSRHSSNAKASGLPTTDSNGADPFSSFGQDSPSAQFDAAASLPSPSATSTAIAAYLTTISNAPGLRQMRVWKRFVRVRTDDLESVRVERAIKRVQSDVATRVGLSGKGGQEKENKAAPAPSTSVDQEQDADLPAPEETLGEREVPLKSDEEKQLGNEEKAKDDGVSEVGTSPGAGATDTRSSRTSTLSSTMTQSQSPTTGSTTSSKIVGDEAPSTPITSSDGSGPSSRIRSLSADQDKRLSRPFTSSDVHPDSGLSSQTETGDESSAPDSSSGPSGRHRSSRKKRSVTGGSRKEKKSSHKVVIDDFEMMRVLGKGCAGKVLLVRHKPTEGLYALKAITKRHVLAHQELQHTLTEQAVLKRMAAENKDPFVVKLWWSFHDKENLFLVMDFHPGGDLATQLARWGRLGRDRARFYAAEIVEGVEGLHNAGVIYRDLKPENILIGGDGHIVLTDFGLSREFPRRNTTSTAPATPSGTREFFNGGSPQAAPTTPPWMKADKSGEMALGWPGQPVGHGDSTATFCGTAEYLAPEVIQGLQYSYEVDWWSFGTMLFEMLTGITPFWAANHTEMYARVLQDELQFPDDRAIDQDTKSLIRGLLQRNPALRICEPRIKRHPYFQMIDWSHVYYKRYIPPYIPPIDPSNASDTQNFDDTFLDMEPVLDEVNDVEQTEDTDQEQTDTDRTDGDESNTTPSQSRSSSAHPKQDDTVDVFDGYSFKGRHSVLIDDDEDDASGDETDEADSLEQPPSTLEPAESEDYDAAEPKTPEARPTALPPDDASTAPPTEETTEVAPTPPSPVVESKPRRSKELPRPGSADPEPPSLPEKKPAVPPKSTKPTRLQRGRREKSGVPALDRYLSDTVDEDGGDTRPGDEEDEEWDLIEAVDGEDRNGARGTSLFARGVVDRYKLAVFRKASTPSRSTNGRSFSAMSEATMSDAGESPSPQRRGRNPGLTFRKNPRQFLQPKSPPSSYSSKSGTTAKSSLANSATLSASSTTSGSGLLVSSPSAGTTAAGSSPGSPSLKSKQSALSVGAQSLSSDQSGGAEAVENIGGPDGSKGPSPSAEEPEKQKNKKLKKYKENAEKVFSIFSGSSPRQQQQS